MTEDGSAGLYDENIKDIYHSKTGALKEAYDKFIEPSFLCELSEKKSDINILDICYGIGYNSKCALMYNNKSNLHIDCLDINSDLIFLSPFIKDNIYDINLKLFLLSEIFKLGDISYIFYERKFNRIYENNADFFEPSIVRLIQFLITKGYIYSGSTLNLSFLHNIYYNYISTDMKNDVKSLKYINSSISFKFGDARLTLQKLNKFYDVIFLDAFTPQKAPELWTINFLNLIKNKMSKNSVLVTYSKSTPFRSALIELGFFVGKIYINDIDMGSVASFDKNKIINPLTDYDYSLINTRAGIFYEDYNLSLSPSEIINNRENKISLSDRISHTAFRKSH